MAVAPGGVVALAIVDKRRLAADIILLGYDDSDVATVISDGQTAGYRFGQAVVSAAVGGIIGGINR